MKLATILVTTALLLWSGAALAAPGDLVTIQGSITQQRDTALVVQDASGKTYYIDARPIANLGTLRAGQRVTVIGTQGAQPELVTALNVDTAGAQSGDDYVASGWRLPRSHKYEQYSPERGQYQPADVNAVPGLIERGTWVFDRTAGVWLNHPSVGGRNPQYLATATTTGATTAASTPAAGSGWQRIHGQVQQAQGSQLVFRTDDGRTLNVDMHDVSASVQHALTPNEGATVIGFPGAKPNEFRARYVQQDSSDPSRGGHVAAKAVDQSAWQRIHGSIESVQGSTLTLRADDNRTLTVDMAKVDPNIRRALTKGEGVEIVGHFGSDAQHLTAQFIQQDSSNPSRGGRVTGKAPAAAGSSSSSAASAAPDQKAWQRIHGTIESISGRQVQLRADDGKQLRVDVSAVSENIVHALTVGEPVTVIGHFGADKNHVTAQYVQQERAGGAASPKTKGK